LRSTHNLLEVFRALRENADNLDYAWRILTQGVCDGCALGTKGLNDWTMENIHLCNVRLRLLRLNTMPALDVRLLEDVTLLRGRRSRELRMLGRLPYPMVRRRGERGFRRIPWDEALGEIADRIRRTHPDRTYFYMTSRGEPNENYYALQKAVRAIGTNNMDNAARICHSPSTFALKEALGVAATTCSYRDLIGTDLVVFFGSHVANNQPVMMKYLYYAKKAGTRVAVVNPYREPAMERYYVPSDLESALFGTRITDRFFQVRPGGDVAFLVGVAKHMLREGWVDRHFIEAHTMGFREFAAAVEAAPWEVLEQGSGLSRGEMRALAEMVGRAERAVFVWGWGSPSTPAGRTTSTPSSTWPSSMGSWGDPGAASCPSRDTRACRAGRRWGPMPPPSPAGSPSRPRTLGACRSCGDSRFQTDPDSRSLRCWTPRWKGRSTSCSPSAGASTR